MGKITGNYGLQPIYIHTLIHKHNLNISNHKQRNEKKYFVSNEQNANIHQSHLSTLTRHTVVRYVSTKCKKNGNERDRKYRIKKGQQ